MAAGAQVPAPSDQRLPPHRDGRLKEPLGHDGAGAAGELPEPECVLQRAGVEYAYPRWSPDGKRILFNSTRGGGSLDVCAMNPDGSDQVAIVASADNETCGRLSPDGRRPVYLRNNEKGLDDVFLLEPAADEPRNLTGTPTRDGWPCWTPSGKGIVYSAVQDGSYKLFHLDIASGELTQLTIPEPPAYDARAHVSGDGRRIVCNRQVDSERNTIGIWTLPFDDPR